MPNVVLFEDEAYADLLPAAYWRSVHEFRVGRKILLDRTAQRLALPVSGVWVRDWIAKVAALRCGAPVNHPAAQGTVLVNGRWLVESSVKFSTSPVVGTVGDDIAYIVCDDALAEKLTPAVMLSAETRTRLLQGVPRQDAGGKMLRYPWDIIGCVAETLTSDFGPADVSIESKIDPKTTILNREQVHIGERTVLHPTAILDADSGPIFISHDVSVGAFSMIQGPAYVGPGSRINPYAHLHGGVAIGPVCRIGGELNGCIIDGYTNKQHEGFLGHAYVGSWVNLGAGCTNSNLKNTYGHVRVSVRGEPIDTGMTFFGAVIADHAKVGIQAAIPTGAVIGFAANIASTRLLPKQIPSFGWLTDDGLSAGDPARLLDVATKVMARRDVDMTDDEIELFLDLGSRIPSLESTGTVPPR